MTLYVAAYDIGDDGRRAQAAKVLLRFGCRVQRSVFTVRLGRRALGQLKREIGPCLEPDDRFDLFPLDERMPARRVSWSREPESWDPVAEC